MRSSNETTWRELIGEALEDAGESWSDLLTCTLTQGELDTKFYCGYGCSKGAPFTMWTANRVYFPVVYDGLEWVASVPRHPCDVATSHIGGE